MCKCTNPTRLTPSPPLPPASSYQRSDLQIKILQSFNYRFDYDCVVYTVVYTVYSRAAWQSAIFFPRIFTEALRRSAKYLILI